MLEINNLTRTKVDAAYLKKVAAAALKKIKRGNAELSAVFVGERRMRILNWRYRGKNRPTDVLSFSQEDAEMFVKAPEKVVRLGEVVLCASQAKKQAKRAGHSLRKELTVLLIHGILHLGGYDHERSEKEAEKMEELQERIVANIRV